MLSWYTLLMLAVTLTYLFWRGYDRAVERHRIDGWLRRFAIGNLMAGLTWVQVPTGALAAMAQAAVQLYVSFGLVLLFFDTRRRKEGSDLESAIEGLAARGAEARE